jgi:WD40 repeat protein
MTVQRARALFVELVSQVPEEQWEARLAELAGEDIELRNKVAALLAAHRKADSFLEQPAGPLGGTVDDLAPALAQPAGEAARGDKLGTVVAGRYKLIEAIGEGGMGTVYLAQQTEPVKRLVALKVIKAGMDSRQVIARFEAERQALALMDHPNIARVLDAGTTESGRPFFVMELVKGVPLTKYCDEHHLTPKQRLELFVPVCQAIQHAHQKGIIHRDIKPSNVLVALYDGKPVPKVIDFGIAKATGQQLTEHTLVTGFGTLVGTLEYMSPEQAELNQLDIDTRSDNYSLGVLLYELLTGSTPLESKQLKQAAMLEVLRLIREEEPPRPSTRLSTMAELPAVAANRGLEPNKLSGLLRGELDWIVMKALDKDRDRRYETADGLARDVQRYLADEPVQACPPSALYRFRKFVRRNKALVTAATVVAVTLLMAGAVVTWKWWDAEGAREQEQQAKAKAEATRDEARAAEKRAKQSEERAVAAERQSRLREAEALVGQARGTRLSQRPGQRFEALAALKKAAAIGRELGQPAAWFDPLRNEAIAALALPDLQITREFGRIPPGQAWVGLSDDFELYVQTTEQGDCTVRRVADDAEVARLPALGEFAYADFGPGQTIAVLGKSTRAFRLWDVSGGAPAWRLEAKGVYGWTFHPNGRSLALMQNDGDISVYAVATGKPLHLFRARQTRQDLRFHPTEPLIAGSSYFSPVVSVYDLETGAVVASATSTWPLGNGRGDWSPDGRTLLVPEADGARIQEYAFDSGPPALRPLRTLDAPYQGFPVLTFNPAGDRFVTRGWSGTVHLFDAGSGQLLLKTPALPRWTDKLELHFDHTGQRLAGARVGDANDRIGVWSFAPGREYRSLVATDGAEHQNGPAIHRGGRLTAIGRANGLALFDLETGRELAFVSLPGNHTVARFDGAGNLLTNGYNGFFRWPVQLDPANPGRLIVGPPGAPAVQQGTIPRCSQPGWPGDRPGHVQRLRHGSVCRWLDSSSGFPHSAPGGRRRGHVLYQHNSGWPLGCVCGP